MSQDPNAEFDHQVLDVIERSPTGAVPFTPAYRDALRRLYQAHQVYPNADHKEGHVTARSLGALPVFHAHNIAVLAADENGELEPNDAIYSRYVSSLPPPVQSKAEAMRATVAGRPAQHRAKHGVIVAHDPVHSLFLVPGAGPQNPGLPGNYLYGFVAESSGSAAHHWSVHLHDAADGAALYNAASVQDALDKFQEVLESAPFQMAELEGLGFRLI